MLNRTALEWFAEQKEKAFTFPFSRLHTFIQSEAQSKEKAKLGKRLKAKCHPFWSNSI